MRGWIFRVARVVGCGLACAFGLSAQAVDWDCNSAHSQCDAAVAANAANLPGAYSQERERTAAPPGKWVDMMRPAEFGGGIVNSYACVVNTCGSRPPIEPTWGFSSPPETSCDDGCEYEWHCDGSGCPVSIGGRTTWFGSIRPTGNTCTGGNPPPTPPDDPPCDPLSGICVKPGGPKFCGQDSSGVEHCVPVPNAPACDSSATGAVCVGEPVPVPNAPPPPPQPPDPPITPGENDGHGDGAPTYCNGFGSCSNIQVSNYPGGDGPGTGDPGDNDPPDPEPGGGDDGGAGDDDGQGGQLCPDGTHPVNDRCQADAEPCPDGSQPSQGTCVGDAPDPDENGHCPDGSVPASGVCPWTCPDGSHPISGRCDASYQPCADGSQPVNGTCPVGHCNPSTDPEGCGEGHADGGGSCAAPPSCYGGPILCAQLFQNWKTRCAMETSDPVLFDTDIARVQDELSAMNVENSWQDTAAQGALEDWIDAGGLGLPRTCPRVEPITVFTTTVEFPQVWCGLLEIMGTLLIISCTWVAAKIVAGGV